MRDGFVALLDVLGFADLAAGDHTGSKMNRYLECVRDTMQGSTVDYVVFSDSIVLTAKGDSAEPLAAIAGACSKLLWSLLDVEIALRGAISFGRFSRESFEDGVFVAGRAVIDAYRFEKLQDWIGVMIAPSALSRVPDLSDRCRLPGNSFQDVESRYPWSAFVQRCHTIPFHASGPFQESDFDGFAIVPTNGELDAPAIRDSIKAALSRLGWLRVLAPTPDSQMKYRKTIDWLSETQGRWRDIAFLKEKSGANQ